MRKQVSNQEQIIEALDLAEMGLTAEQAYKIGRITGDLLSSAFALGRVAAAEDVDRMPTELGDEGWGDLESRAVNAGYDAETVRRRRRGDFTTTTIEAAYQYGYRQASKVARGVTRPQPSCPNCPEGYDCSTGNYYTGDVDLPNTAPSLSEGGADRG